MVFTLNLSLEQMHVQHITPWGQDELSRFLETAEYNARVTSLTFSDVYRLLQRTDSAFREITEGLERDFRQDLLVPRFLIAKTRSSFLGSIRLSMSGQVPESYSVLRTGIEQAWYALHIAKDQHAPKRAEVWMCRNDDEAAKKKCKTEFQVKKVHLTHESFDTMTARRLHILYEKLIDLGAHPNQQVILASMNLSETSGETIFQVGLLAPKPITVLLALKQAVEAAVGMFKIFQLIFPERFKIMSWDNEIDKLINEANAIFKKYGNQLKTLSKASTRKRQ